MNEMMNPDGRVDLSWLQQYAPFIRVATSSTGFISYDAREVDGQVVIKWMSKDGSSGSVKLDQVDVPTTGGTPARLLWRSAAAR
jgi:hypothetical protein